MTKLGLAGLALPLLVHAACQKEEPVAAAPVLSPGEAARVVAEVLSYFGEPVQDFVRRRHGELQRRGLRNEQIFELLTAELAVRRFRPPQLTPRQLRRMIYG